MMDWADLFSNPPWPESSPSRREVKKPMPFLDTLVYGAPVLDGAPMLDSAPMLDDAPTFEDSVNPYGAPAGTDWPAFDCVVPSSLARRSVLSPSRRAVLSPSRRGVLSRSGSGRSIFGESRSVFGDNTNVFDDSTNVFTDSANVFNDSTNLFDDSRNLFGDSKNLFGDSRNLFGDSLENFSSGLRYTPSDRTGSVSDGDLPYAPSDRTDSMSDVEPYDALEVRSLPSASEAECAGEEGQQQSADEEEQAIEGRSYTEIIFPLMPGLLLPEPSFAFAPRSPSFVPPSPSIMPPSPSILPPSPSILHPSPSILPPYPSISPPYPSISPPYPSADVPARAQSPASALASLARFYGCFPDATYPAPLDAPYPAPCDPSYPAAGDSSCHAPLDAPYPAACDQPYPPACEPPYPAACDQPTRGEEAATHQSTAVHHDAARSVEYDEGTRDEGARDEGARDGGARNGDDTGGAQSISPRATSTATDAENAQTKPRRKARKSKGRARAAVDDSIEQTAPRATAPQAPAAASAFHSAVHASHSASPASHAAVPVSHSVARASHPAARASHSAAHDDSPEYAAVTAQRRQAKRARKARGMNGRAVIDSAVDAVVAIAASVPDFAPAPRSVARVQPVAARGQTAVNASAHEQAAPTAHAQEHAPAQGVTQSQVVTSSAPAPANGTGITAASRVPNALPPAHVYPAALTPAAAPSAAAYAPHSALTSASVGATISSHPLAPPAPASSGSRTPAMLWQALLKGELTSEEMQAHLRPDVKKQPMLEGARADVLRSVTLSEGVPMAPPSFGSLSMGASSDSMGHPAGSSSSSPRGMKRKHGHDAQPEDPNWTRCQWTHFDAKNQPMGPCTHFYNKKSDRAALRENVREHMRKMEPNRCDGIFCQWSHDCKRHNQYFVDLYAVVDHIVDIILGTEMRVRR